MRLLFNTSLVFFFSSSCFGLSIANNNCALRSSEKQNTNIEILEKASSLIKKLETCSADSLICTNGNIEYLNSESPTKKSEATSAITTPMDQSIAIKKIKAKGENQYVTHILDGNGSVKKIDLATGQIIERKVPIKFTGKDQKVKFSSDLKEVEVYRGDDQSVEKFRLSDLFEDSAQEESNTLIEPISNPAPIQEPKTFEETMIQKQKDLWKFNQPFCSELQKQGAEILPGENCIEDRWNNDFSNNSNTSKNSYNEKQTRSFSSQEIGRTQSSRRFERSFSPSSTFMPSTRYLNETIPRTEQDTSEVVLENSTEKKIGYDQESLGVSDKLILAGSMEQKIPSKDQKIDSLQKLADQLLKNSFHEQEPNEILNLDDVTEEARADRIRLSNLKNRFTKLKDQFVTSNNSRNSDRSNLGTHTSQSFGNRWSSNQTNDLFPISTNQQRNPDSQNGSTQKQYSFHSEDAILSPRSRRRLLTLVDF